MPPRHKRWEQIERPAWISDMIRKWMYNPPPSPLKEWFRYPAADGGVFGARVYKGTAVDRSIKIAARNKARTPLFEKPIHKLVD